MKDVREVQAVVDGLMYGACDRLEDYHSKRDGENAIKWFREALSAANLEIGPGWNTDMEAGKKCSQEENKSVLVFDDSNIDYAVTHEPVFVAYYSEGQWCGGMVDDGGGYQSMQLFLKPTAWKPILPPEGGE